MNKKQIRKLAWKYFWKQKWEEITDCAANLAITMIVLGTFLQLGWVIYQEENIIAGKVIAIIGLCFLGFWILVGIIAIIKCFFNWIKDNWKEALEKANEESERERVGKEKKK